MTHSLKNRSGEQLLTIAVFIESHFSGGESSGQVIVKWPIQNMRIGRIKYNPVI